MSEDKAAGTGASADEELEQIVEAADKLGVHVDKEAASQWLTAVTASQALPQDWVADRHAGIFGNRITLLDFDPAVLERYRRLATIVEIPDRPGVETAISLAGSAAQSRIQLFPGDADFFERVNVQAPTREEACRLLGDVMREKALDKLRGDEFELVEVKWGTFKHEFLRADAKIKPGMPISWNAQEVKQGCIQLTTPGGEPATVDWAYGCQDPGWCKLDWVVTEVREGSVVHASNMLDVTWESPAGDIVPLDGFLDPYYQEVYLDAQSIPLFSKLIKHLSPDALQDYVAALKHQVIKYSQQDPRNFGKVAKRLYNIFRLEGHWAEAAYVRDLFDEPAALLYQVSAVLDTIDEALQGGVVQDRDALVEQVDQLIREVVRATEGPMEEKIVDGLLKLRDDVSGRRGLGDAYAQVVGTTNRLVSDLVNEYFRDRLLLMPEVRLYIESLEELPA